MSCTHSCVSIRGHYIGLHLFPGHLVSKLNLNLTLDHVTQSVTHQLMEVPLRPAVNMFVLCDILSLSHTCTHACTQTHTFTVVLLPGLSRACVNRHMSPQHEYQMLPWQILVIILETVTSMLVRQ